jgi:serine/threonine-protein kinase
VGRGGAAEVYEVADPATEQRLALKRLVPSDAGADFAEVMLAREYNALVQLSHPLIIRAFDYGKDAGVAYYTMELLSGKNLRRLAPLGWREACELLRDVASALAIVHSRRLVHRDVTTRNICRVADGHAKLLDFGALTPMGPIRDQVGTPPFVPPEAMDEQRLDGRADLYALGAVLYFVLTGVHAYPASSFRELGNVWRLPVSPPSAARPDVPPALDELVLSLLSLSRTARPQSAAEVFQRLTAIADLPSGERPEVAQAYLSTPSLVGREPALERVQKQLDRLKLGKGGALLVEGNRGLGRSRLLGACLLEAKLRGFLTLRTVGRDANTGPFQALRSLARELSIADAALFREATAEDDEFLQAFIANRACSSDENWQRDALRLANFFAGVARKTPLVVAVDDVDAADDLSLGALYLLSKRARRVPLLLVYTSTPEARRTATKALRRATSSVTLEAFTQAETRVLVSTLFGAAPHVEGLAEWMHRLTDGNPGRALELAQHLVDRGVATYQEGAWALPASMEGLGLPETIDQALEARLCAMSPGARALAQILALTSEHEPLLVTDYASLSEGANLAPLFEALNELIAGSILVSAGAAYLFAHQELLQVARRSVPEDGLTALHRRLAHAYGSGSGRGTVLVVYHLYHAGDLVAAFHAAVAAITQRIDQNARGSALARSPDWSKIAESLFVWGIANGMQRRDLVLLGRSLLQLASVVNVELARHAALIFEPLRRETGLVHWDDLAGVVDPTERMQRCLALAYEEWERTPESERGLDPRQAITELATSAAMLVGVYSRESDAKGAAEIVALLEPLRTMAPAVDVIAQVVELAERAMRGLDVTAQRHRVFERVSEPVPGLDDLSRQGMRFVMLYYLALEGANHGHDGAAERVTPLDQYPHFAPLAWQVRMLSHLFRGEDERADEARRRRDAAAIGRADVDRHFDVSVIYEASASSMLGDLLPLERSLSVITERAKRSPGWAPYHHAFRGNHHALRGETARALEEHEQAVALVPRPGVHAAWAYCINCLAGSLVESERAEEAVALVQQAIVDAKSVDVVPHVRAQLEMSLAVARASLGESAEATELARRAVEGMLACGTKGVILLDHYAKQALVAVKAGDAEAFQSARSNIESMSGFTRSAAFAAKHEYLLRQARMTATIASTPAPADLASSKESHTTIAVGVRSPQKNCNGTDD